MRRPKMKHIVLATDAGPVSRLLHGSVSTAV